MNDNQLLVGLLSISDRASHGVYEDLGIPALEEWFGRALSSPWRTVTRLIADDQASIERRRARLQPGPDHRRHRPGTARRHAGSDAGHR